MKRITATVAGCILALCSLAQKQDAVWIFGDSCGIDFNNLASPTFFTTNEINNDENFASICDKQGNLLFYVNGAPKDTNGNFTKNSRIFNSQYQLMLSGDSIKTDYSQTQGTLIVPFPNDSNKYYIFHLLARPSPPYEQYYFYSIVDMALDGGLGGLSSKNIPLDTLNIYSEKQVLIRHGNGRDWWLVTHLLNSNAFRVYLITINGISLAASQNIGTVIGNQFCDAPGQMVASKNGDRIAFANVNGILNLFDFDRCNGVLSSFVNLSNLNSCYGYYGCAMSANGNVLYVSTFDALFQFDLTAANILSTKLSIWSDTDPTDFIGQLRLAPDNKIYMSISRGFPPIFSGISNTYLSVVNSPDLLGVACNFSPYSFYLNGHKSTIGLPNMPNYNLGRWENSACDTLTSLIEPAVEEKNIIVFPNPANDLVRINYQFEGNENVELCIYDDYGKEIMMYNLNNSKKWMEINTSYLAAGVYSCKFLKNGNFVEVKRLIVIK